MDVVLIDKKYVNFVLMKNSLAEVIFDISNKI